MKARSPSSTESATPDAADAEGPESQEIERVPDAGAPPIERGLGPHDVVWEILIADPAKLSPEVQEAALTRGLPIEIRLWGNDLEKLHRLVRQSAIDEQIKATLDKQLDAVAAKLRGMADQAASDSQASTLGDALARELLGGIARQPHLVGPLRGVLQGPVGAVSTGNTVLMKRAEHAKRIAVSARKLDDLIEQGLPTKGKGRMLRIKVAGADRWVEDHLDDVEPHQGDIEAKARRQARTRKVRRGS